MKKLLLLPIIAINLLATAQTTAIPDANFEQALINLGYDNVIDGGVLTANISGVTFLDVSNGGISDLTGIEDFTALLGLECAYNQLTSLDVTGAIALDTLYCPNNQLTNLDVSQNTALTYLRCEQNQLTSIDVSQNTALEWLNCGNNQLTSIDVSQNTALIDLFCYNNQLTNLDVSQNTTLTELACADNNLTSLDVTGAHALIIILCFNNQLTSIDVTQNPALEDLWCHNNHLTTLDVAQNTALTWLNCQSNYLFCLNVKNGNNSNISWLAFNASSNSSLTCIEVDDAAYSTANWTSIDPQTSFSTNCNNPCAPPTCADGMQNGDETGVDCGGTICPPCATVGIVDENVKAITLLPNPTTSAITLNNLQLGDEVSVYNTLGQRVYSSKVIAVTLSIKLSELGNNGIYFVRVNDISERVLLSR